jgi:uracil-DNA glycosylase family 4
MAPSLSGHQDRYRVALVGEALGAEEEAAGAPFIGKAGHKLTRLIEWAGLDRSRFDIFNTAWCRPPNNKLEGEAYEHDAIAHCRSAHWGSLLQRSRVVVPMGNVPLHAFTGRKGILSVRGYVANGDGFHLVPTVHPSFIQRGQSKYSAPFIHDLQKAVELARDGMVFEQVQYELDPLPSVAYAWAKRYVHNLEAGHVRYLAYDIETPYKGDDEGDLDADDDPTYFIERIGFSYAPHTALSIPWEGPYLPAIKLLLESGGEKVVWNAGFDNPRIRHNGVAINGLVHDGMVAWHVLHSDLPKGLGFVATFTCPYQPAWKHLSGSRPAFYNATDADVELRSMLAIEDELRRTGLWDVYEKDVLDLDPILTFMSGAGMPIDASIRATNAQILDEKLRFIKGELEGLIPMTARKIEKVFVGVPKDTTGLLTRPGRRVYPTCPQCGLQRPRKDHYKVFKKKVNLCGGRESVPVEQQVTEYYRLGEFKPSREQLIRYQQVNNRTVPKTRDKKTGAYKPSMDEKAIKTLILKYPGDPVYNLVLEYRELDKLAGTYIGRPSGDVS